MSQYDDLGKCSNCGAKIWEISGKPAHNVTSFVNVCGKAAK